MNIKTINRVVAAGSLGLVLAWHLVATWDKPRLEKIAAELASTKEFFGTSRPNHAGTQLFYMETTTNGINAFMVDTANGRKKFLFNHDQSHLEGVDLLGWSPDDTLFAYSVRSPAGQIVICDGDSHETLATVSESKIIEEGVWLSNESLVYVNKNSDLTLLTKAGVEWHKSRLFTPKPAGQASPPDFPVVANTQKRKRTVVRINPQESVRHLTALSKNSVAWQQGGAIWRYEPGAEAPEKIWESTTNLLLNFGFSKEHSVLNLYCRGADGDVVGTLYPAYIWREQRPIEFTSITPGGDAAIANLTFLPKTLGYACVIHSPRLDAISLCTDSNAPPLQSVWEAGVESVAASDDHLFITDSPTNGPLDIWDYDFKTRSLNGLVSGLEHPFKYAGTVTAIQAVATNAGGTLITYHLSPPVHLTPGKKYPLVIGFTGFRWRPQEAAVPNAECFFAAANGIPAAEDVLAIHQSAIQNPGVDAARVYVMGISAGAGLAGELLQAWPDLWQGAILLSPVYFPKASRLKATRILIDSGGNDAYLKETGGVGKLMQFQDASAVAGIPVTVAIQEKASHVYRSNIAEGDRIRHILEFLSAN